MDTAKTAKAFKSLFGSLLEACLVMVDCHKVHKFIGFHLLLPNTLSIHPNIQWESSNFWLYF